MYCSSCGVAVAQGLSYCNYCGAKLIGTKGDDEASPDVKPELVVSAMAGVFILGLGAIAVLIGMLKEVADFDLPILLAVTMLSFLIMIIIEGVLIRLLLRGKKRSGEAGTSGRFREQVTKELLESQARALPEPLASVTEHTTRTFEPVYSDPKSK